MSRQRRKNKVPAVVSNAEQVRDAAGGKGTAAGSTNIPTWGEFCSISLFK